MTPDEGSSQADPSAAAKPAALTRDIVAIGASAGGVATLQQLMATLPADLPAALFVVVHIATDAKSELPGILTRAGPLVARHAEDGMPIAHGHVYVAKPDHHLLLEHDRIRVVRGPLENRHRPAIDPLFRSAAWAFGPRAIGVVLSGTLDDGTAGLWAIKSCGGITVVQDPADALYAEMPTNALRYNDVDFRLPLAGIAPRLARLVTARIDGTPPLRERTALQAEIALAALRADANETARLGALSPFTCPSCGGALWEIDENQHMRYRCHTGHAFSEHNYVAAQTEAVETALYVALRTVQQKATALRRLADRDRALPSTLRADYLRRARELDDAAERLRGLLAGNAV